VYQMPNALLDEINRVREMMITVALENGFTSDEAVRYSQELDTLIYEYQKLCREIGLQRKKTNILFRQALLLTKKRSILSQGGSIVRLFLPYHQ